MTDKLYVEHIGGDNVKVEWFEYHLPDEPQMLVWNVTKARYLVEHKKSESVLTLSVLDLPTMVSVLERNEWTEAHAATCNPRIPGIAAPVIWEGQIIYQLIDGIHRCARALQIGILFKAHLLTDNAARSCYTGPPRYVP